MENSADITVFDVAPGEDESWFILVDGTILGACHERLWPYEIAKFAEKPPKGAFTDAAKHTAVFSNKATEFRRRQQPIRVGHLPHLIADRAPKFDWLDYLA